MLGDVVQSDAPLREPVSVLGHRRQPRPGLILPSVSDSREETDPGRRTESGTPFQPVYGPADLADFDPASALGEPGGFPYTRGVHPTMYTTRPWTMRQYAGFGTAAESNARYLE